MAKFVIDTSGATWWPNLEPMQVAFFFLAEEITRVKEAIPWVRCASGNVFYVCLCLFFGQIFFAIFATSENSSKSYNLIENISGNKS